MKIMKTHNGRINFASICVKCQKKKSCFIKKETLDKLHRDKERKFLLKLQAGEEYPDNDSEDVKTGGLLPLAALLPLIFGGITAASATAGTVATAVQNSKKNEEQERHNREIEKIARGSGAPSDSEEEDEEVATAFEVIKRKGYGIHSY